METTTNYKLPQWVKEDPIKMQDFNAAFASIDAALKAETDARSEADGTAAERITALAPRDVDLADVFALADAEHCARVELFAPLRLRAEGVGRTAAVPERVDGENAVALRQFCAECAVILLLGGHGLGRHAGAAPGVGRPTAETDGIGRIIAEIERYGIEIGG